MNLFDNEANPETNLLPYDGSVYYYGKIFSPEEAQHYATQLMNNILWKPDEALMFGKRIFTKRKVAWYADFPFEYTYSKVTKRALPWTPDLLQLKARTEQITGASFNSCLLNLYHTGEEGMAWHSDGEADLLKNGPIASLSFGAERKFAFKHKITHEKVELILEAGSLLIMTGSTQQHWLHRLPPTKKISQPRINLTFRIIVK